MPTPEKKVKTAILRILNKYNVWYCMPATGGYGRSGIPDFLCCFKGKFIAIEAKAKGNNTTPLQERELLAIEAAGGIALLVNEDLLEALELKIKWLASL